MDLSLHCFHTILNNQPVHIGLWDTESCNEYTGCVVRIWASEYSISPLPFDVFAIEMLTLEDTASDYHISP